MYWFQPASQRMDTAQLPFKYPTITICNSKVLTGSILSYYNFSFNLLLKAVFFRLMRQQYSENQEFVSNLFKTHQLHINQGSELFTETFRDTFENYYPNFTAFSKYQTDIKHMIIDCLVGMKHKACSNTVFYEIRHPKYLRCYTFNHSLFESAVGYSSMTSEDIKNGLALHLKLTLIIDGFPGTENVNNLFSDNYRLRYGDGMMIQIRLSDEYPMTQYQRIHRVSSPAAPYSNNVHNSTVAYKSLIVSKKDGSFLSGKFRYRSEDCRMGALVVDGQTKYNCSLFELPVNDNLSQLTFCHDLSRLSTLSECLSNVHDAQDKQTG